MGRPPCCDDISEMKKGPWTPEEDEKLTSYIRKHGHGSWQALPKVAGLNRCGKSCRLRWTNYLRPNIKRGRFSEEEEDMIIKLHSVAGNKWSKIAAHLPGRTDNEIKNYWNTHLRKRLLQMGIDPITHKPRTDLNFLANLSQIIPSPPNLSTLMNPWDINTSLRLQLQPNVTELAKLQVLQTIFHILNTSNSFANMNQTMALNRGYPNNVMFSSSQGLYNQTPTPDTFESNPERKPLSSSDTNCNNKNLSSSYSSQNDNNTLPSLEAASTVEQFEEKTSSAFTPTSDFFVGLEKFLDDDNNDYCWNEFSQCSWYE